MAHKHLPVSLANPSPSPIWSSLSLTLSRFWFPRCEWSTGQMHHQTKVSHIPVQTNTETDPGVSYSSQPHQSMHPWLSPKITTQRISFVFFPWISCVCCFVRIAHMVNVDACMYLCAANYYCVITVIFLVRPTLCQTLTGGLVNRASLELHPN